MANLESPFQRGDKGNSGADSSSAKGGKLVSPVAFNPRGEAGSEVSQPGGKIVSPNYGSAAKEASGHGDGRSAKGNDAPKNRAFMS